MPYLFRMNFLRCKFSKLLDVLKQTLDFKQHNSARNLLILRALSTFAETASRYRRTSTDIPK